MSAVNTDAAGVLMEVAKKNYDSNVEVYSSDSDFYRSSVSTNDDIGGAVFEEEAVDITNEVRTHERSESLMRVTKEHLRTEEEEEEPTYF